MCTTFLRRLARLKHLRGTAFDPFSYLAERRLERRLIGEYEAVARRVLAGLTADNEMNAVAILTLFDEIRGFGPVKEDAARRMMAVIASRLTAYEKPRDKARLPDAA